MSDKYGFAFVAWASNLDVGGARRQLQVVDDIGFDEMSAVGKTFDNSIDLHVLTAPPTLWRSDLRYAYASICMEAVSSGFVRVSPKLTLKALRETFKDQLESEALPSKYHFLKNVGRHMALVSSRQEDSLNIYLFAPPFMAVSEIFIIDAQCIGKSPSSPSTLVSLGQPTPNAHRRYSLSPLRPSQHLARSSHYSLPPHCDIHLRPVQQINSGTVVDYHSRRRAATLDGSELMRHVTAALGNITEEPFPLCGATNKHSVDNKQSDTACATIASTSQESSIIADSTGKKTDRVQEKRHVIASVSDNVQDSLPSNLISSMETTTESSSLSTTDDRSVTSNPESSLTSSWVTSDPGATSLQSSSWVNSVDSCQSILPNSPGTANLHVDMNLQGIEVAAATVALERTLFGVRPDGEGASICDDESDGWVGDDEMYQISDRSCLKGVVESSKDIKIPTRTPHQTPNSHSSHQTPNSHSPHQTPNSHSSHQTPNSHSPHQTPNSHSPHQTPNSHSSHQTPNSHSPHQTPNSHLPHQTPNSHSSHQTPNSHSSHQTPNSHSPHQTPNSHSSHQTPNSHSPHQTPNSHLPHWTHTPLNQSSGRQLSPQIMSKPRQEGQQSNQTDTSNRRMLSKVPRKEASSVLGGFLAEEKCLVKSPLVDHQGDENQRQKASFPKSPPLPPIESVAADFDVVLNTNLADLRTYRNSRTKMLTRYRELCSKTKTLKEALKNKSEQDEQHWKKMYSKEKQLHCGLQDHQRDLERELQRLSQRVRTTTPNKGQSAAVSSKPSQHNNMKASALRLEQENSNLEKRIKLTQEELKLEQESHRVITEDYKQLKKTLTKKKIARKNVKSLGQ